MFPRDENVNLCGVDTKIVTQDVDRSCFCLRCGVDTLRRTSDPVWTEHKYTRLSLFCFGCDVSQHTAITLFFVDYAALFPILSDGNTPLALTSDPN